MAAEKPIEFNPVDGVNLLRNYILHCRCVRRGILMIQHELAMRAEQHDDSKLMADEFAGFTRINAAAREHPFGSEEYKDGLKREQPTVQKHYDRNSHHPESSLHQPQGAVVVMSSPTCKDMGWLDIVEMVCDWRGAYLAYRSQGTWKENLQRQRERYADRFTGAQWWLVEQVAQFVEAVK